MNPRDVGHMDLKLAPDGANSLMLVQKRVPLEGLASLSDYDDDQS